MACVFGTRADPLGGCCGQPILQRRVGIELGQRGQPEKFALWIDRVEDRFPRELGRVERCQEIRDCVPFCSFKARKLFGAGVCDLLQDAAELLDFVQTQKRLDFLRSLPGFGENIADEFAA
ncbi:hypothetical protein MTX20_37630 [Bradyrhizobium sp. ISRA435]|nr:hypothetical protein MTX20_37630 [Bradyrhizobium sp. ISRA435]